MTKKSALPILLFAVTFLLAACGKEEPKYERSGLNGYSNTGTETVAATENSKGKALVAADSGKKVQYECSTVQQFPSMANQNKLPTAVPALGITLLGGTKLGVMASTPEKATELVRAADELLEWAVVACKAPGP
ncbi:hypothetical protein [Polaromonas sp.]|uniref:hypothetical protein n=1 Tax=Polaromonas sp. TaxID=1869339 RepID=UPI00352B0480